MPRNEGAGFRLRRDAEEKFPNLRQKGGTAKTDIGATAGQQATGESWKFSIMPFNRPGTPQAGPPSLRAAAKARASRSLIWPVSAATSWR